MFGIVTGSYHVPVAHAEVDASFTNKAPGGMAYRCSFRVTEASFAIERAMDILADELKMDPVELRRKNFIKKEQFPYPSALGFTYDSGDYHKTLDVALESRLHGTVEGAGRGARPWSVDGHRLLDVRRGGGRRAVEALRHPWHQDVRQRRDPHSSDRRGHRAGGHQIARAGPRDHLGADRGRGTGARSAEHHGRGRRHGHRAVRAWHLRQPQHADRRRRDRDGGAPDPRARPQDRGASARGRRRRCRVEGLQVPGEGRPRQERHDEGGGVCRLHQHGPERARARSDADITIRRT